MHVAVCAKDPVKGYSGVSGSDASVDVCVNEQMVSFVRRVLAVRELVPEIGDDCSWVAAVRGVGNTYRQVCAFLQLESCTEDSVAEASLCAVPTLSHAGGENDRNATVSWSRWGEARVVGLWFLFTLRDVGVFILFVDKNFSFRTILPCFG